MISIFAIFQEPKTQHMHPLDAPTILSKLIDDTHKWTLNLKDENNDLIEINTALNLDDCVTNLLKNLVPDKWHFEDNAL